MIAIDVIVPGARARNWQVSVAERLRRAGHDVRVIRSAASANRCTALDAVLWLERAVFRLGSAGLAGLADLAEQPKSTTRVPDLVIDLANDGSGASVAAPTLRIEFQGKPDLLAAASVLTSGAVPVLHLRLDGELVGRAAPMASSRVSVARGLKDVLARAITLILAFVDRHADGGFMECDAKRPVDQPNEHVDRGLALAYLSRSLPRLARRAVDRVRYHGDHWRVGYRFVDGPGTAETGTLEGSPWSVLPDDGKRFYADPFPFERDGRYFLFVEELVHSLKKGVISVSELMPDGSFGVPRKVLEEPFHLSYPQVFARDGEVWMLPETGAGRKLVLYRAERFPDRWTEHCVLLADREIFDATLLEHGGLLWLFATERDGAGDPSDTMAVFFSERLEGPWKAHRRNPILIDKAAARPGGGFQRIGDRILLPIQDGTARYGGGLGLSEVLRLDIEQVALSVPVPIESGGHWPYPQIHTLNRCGRLETIDGLVQVRRQGWSLLTTR